MSEGILRPNERRGLGLDRRALLAGLGAVFATPALPFRALAASPVVSLQAKPDTLALRPGQPATPIWSLAGGQGDQESAVLRFKRGDILQVQLGNATKALNWRGIDGVPASEPLLARVPLQPQATDSFAIPLRHAAPFCVAAGLWGAGQPPPPAGGPRVVADRERVDVDRARYCCSR